MEGRYAGDWASPLLSSRWTSSSDERSREKGMTSGFHMLLFFGMDLMKSIDGHMARGPWARPMARNFGPAQERHDPMATLPVLAQPNSRDVPGPLPWHVMPARHDSIRPLPIYNRIKTVSPSSSRLLFLSQSTVFSMPRPFPTMISRSLPSLICPMPHPLASSLHRSPASTAPQPRSLHQPLLNLALL